MQEEKVILVDEQDNAIGEMGKMEAHVKGLLHRAFSVFIFNKNKLLIQRRAFEKYHSPGMWANTCCSHPRKGESVMEAANRRLMEEMGMKCNLRPAFSFIYKAGFENGLTEHEFDHVLIGFCSDRIEINPDEVAEYSWVDIDFLKKDMEENPDKYTIWFRIAYPKVLDYLREHKKELFQ